jgi:hypothetical protein
VKVRLDTGEDAEARTFDGVVLTVWSPRAFAPGAPIRFSATTDGDTREFEGRTIGSKRVDDTRFEVRLRFVNLRRADRELLTARLGN